MKITVNIHGLDAQIARLRGLAENKIKRAASAALNDAARAGYDAARKEMSRVFDRPTSWVLGGVRYVKAKPDKLESSVDFDNWGNKTGVTVGHILRAEIEGGQRRHKRHEIALARAGILPPGMAIVPGDAADLDQYGNMKGSQIVQIMAWFSAFGEQGYKANMTSKTREKLGKDKKSGAKGFAYFALHKPHGKLLPGVYQRFRFEFGGRVMYAVKPVMIFVRSASYKRRFDFYGVTGRAAREQFDKSFHHYLSTMLKERGL